MENYIIAIIPFFCIGGFISIVAFCKWYELLQLKKHRQLVSASAIGEIRDLDIAVWHAQFDDAIDEKYRFKLDEMKYIRKIIESFQIDLMQTYFKGKTHVVKSKYAIDDVPYFLYCLYIYLRKHQDDYIFLGHEMRKPNDFLLTYRKLHYITFAYCRNSIIFQHYISAWEGNGLTDLIDQQLASNT